MVMRRIFGRLSWNDAEIEGLAATPLTPLLQPPPFLLLFPLNPTVTKKKKRNVNLTQRKV